MKRVNWVLVILVLIGFVIGGFIGTIEEINTDSDRFTLNIGNEENKVLVVLVRNAIRTKL